MKLSKWLVGLLVAGLVVLLPSSSKSGVKSEKPNSVVLSSDSVIILNSEVDGESVGAVISKAKDLCNAAQSGLGSKVGLKKETRLKLFLNTPGGSIQSGLELIEALNGLSCPVDTVTLFAASMGWQIAQNLGERLILRNGVMMSHHARGESQGEFGGSVRTQMANRQQLWDDRVRELDEQTVKRTKGKQTYDSYTKEYDHEMWLTGTKSVAEGYSDTIVTVSCDASLAGVTTQHANFLGMDIAYDLDNCPLNTSPMNIRISAPGAPDGKSINYEVTSVVKEKFLSNFQAKAKQVIPMYW